MQDLSCGIWDLVPQSGIEPRPPALGAQSLGHWTTREVPWEPFQILSFSHTPHPIHEQTQRVCSHHTDKAHHRLSLPGPPAWSAPTPSFLHCCNGLLAGRRVLPLFPSLFPSRRPGWAWLNVCSKSSRKPRSLRVKAKVLKTLDTALPNLPQWTPLLLLSHVYQLRFSHTRLLGVP